MDKIKLILPSDLHHVCQIVTGFLRLKEQGADVEIVNVSADKKHPYHGLPIAFAEYRGRKIAYDLWDGYQDVPDMERAIDECDFYFKRSYSREKNGRLLASRQDKIYPLGFNYHVTHRRNPINEPLWKRFLKPLTGRAPDIYFTTGVFEGKAERIDRQPVILFLTRLWDDDPSLPPEVNAERQQINAMRIEIVRTLKQRYGEAFVGGLNDLPVSRKLAPELIMSADYTERKRYVQLLHSCDICIGTMGLHESIGWKTGEYVAAAKAVVNEHFHYEVTGDYREGKHYFAFGTAQECIDAVQKLVDDPELLYAMKRSNEEYYASWLKPENLVKHTLELVDKALTEA